MAKSIMPQRAKECWVCGSPYVEEHHIFGGPNRKNSEKYGLKVWLCWEHHQGNWSVHKDKEMGDIVKRAGQQVFEAKYSHEMFMKIFGRNYL